MEVKQAHGAARAMVRALRDFQGVEEVLDAAVGAKQAQVAVEERIRVLSASAKKWESAVEEARGQYTSEQNEAAITVERLRDRALELQARFTQEADEARTAREKEMQKALTAGELVKKQLTSQCRELEARRKELEEKLQKARDEYAAMLEKLGVKADG